MTEPLPLSLLNDYLYCPRRAALKVVEGWREANVHTERGDIVHEHADLPGYEVAKGVKLLRALPVFSERLGLNGKCDIVEVRPGGAGIMPAGETGIRARRSVPALTPEPGAGSPGNRQTGSPPHFTLFPVEFKVGKRRQFENDDAQLCAQALCLEEMFNVAVSRGAVFHADSKRRREVEFTAELRECVEKAVANLRALAAQTGSDSLPPAVFKPACEQCSLFEICLPKVTSQPERVARVGRALFET